MPNLLHLLVHHLKQEKVGNSVLQSLAKHDYKGKVFPVNAKGYQEIMGIKAFKSLDEIDEPVDVKM